MKTFKPSKGLVWYYLASLILGWVPLIAIQPETDTFIRGVLGLGLFYAISGFYVSWTTYNQVKRRRKSLFQMKMIWIPFTTAIAGTLMAIFGITTLY